jgi:transposase
VSKRRTHDSEFREGAVRIVMESGKPIAQVARDLGVNEGTLGNWVGKAREATGCADASLTESERTERGRLRSENAEVRMHGVSPRVVVGRRCPKMINGLPHRLPWGFPHRRVFATRAEARHWTPWLRSIEVPLRWPSERILIQAKSPWQWVPTRIKHGPRSLEPARHLHLRSLPSCSPGENKGTVPVWTKPWQGSRDR